MKRENENTSDGLNQIVEIINAKGDTGELKEMIKTPDPKGNEKMD